MGRFLIVAAALTAFAACNDKSKSGGLPPAPEWNAKAGSNMAPAAPGAVNPHAQGMNPHTQEQGGMPPGHPPIDNPHGGGSPDVAAMGIPGPDPNRKINPNNRVKGVIK